MIFGVDASLVLSLLLPETVSPKVDMLFSRWSASGDALVAPALLSFEVVSGLRMALATDRVTPDEADLAFAKFLALPISLQTPTNLLEQVWALGKRFQPRRLYDMAYLALAEINQCEVWTADQRLANFLQGRFPLLRLVTP